MGPAEMREIAAIVGSVLRATTDGRTAAGKPSRANHRLEERVRQEAESRARDVLGRFPLYLGIEL